MNLAEKLKENISKSKKNKQSDLDKSLQMVKETAETFVKYIEDGGTKEEAIIYIPFFPLSAEPDNCFDFISLARSTVKSVSKELEIIKDEDYCKNLYKIKVKNTKTDEELELEKQIILKRMQEINSKVKELIKELEEEYLILDREITCRHEKIFCFHP